MSFQNPKVQSGIQLLKTAWNPWVGLMCTAMVILALLGIAWTVLNDYVDPDSVEARNTLVRTFAAIVAGAVVVFGSLVGLLNYRNGQHQLNIERESQITERFTRAVDQLGATDNDGVPSLEVRLGGIYALERISRDSPADYNSIIDILSSYIRENQKPSPHATRLSTDIETIIDVLGRRTHKTLASEIARRPNLRGVSFANHEVAERDLSYCDLTRTDFTNTLLAETDLTAVQFELGTLNDAVLVGAILMNAELRWTQLVNADLNGANLREANLLGAKLGHAGLQRVDLSGACLIGADLSDADLSYSNLSGANLMGATIDNARFDDAILTGADLEEVNTQLARNLTADQLSTARNVETT